MLLDVMMPRLDGLTACRRLRAAGNRVPVLMLTARDAVGDRVSGLDAGADDYLVKPFELDELLARVRALLRRGAMAAPASEESDVLAFGDLRMDVAAREVTRAGVPLELTRTEYLLLELFMVHPARCSPASRSSARCGASTSSRRPTPWTSTSCTCAARPRSPGSRG
nr:hypothetical protein GCM10020093_036610 [Planobispora longispora]